MVASALGQDKVGDDSVTLVRGGTDGLRDFLTEQGMDTEQASALCRQLEVFAARTLFQPSCPELPSGFVAAVNRARETSVALAG